MGSLIFFLFNLATSRIKKRANVVFPDPNSPRKK